MHDNFYNWIMFGWRQLPNNYPSYNSTGPLRKIELNGWVPKAFSLEDFNSKQQYFVEKKLSGDEPTWKYYYMPVDKNKESHISPFTFYPKFDLYNGVKYGEILPKYSTYFSNQDIKDKMELLFNKINVKHQQLYDNDPKSIHRYTEKSTNTSS